MPGELGTACLWHVWPHNLDPSMNGLMALLWFLNRKQCLWDQHILLSRGGVLNFLLSFIWNLKSVFHRDSVLRVTFPGCPWGPGNPHVDSLQGMLGRSDWWSLHLALSHPCDCPTPPSQSFLIHNMGIILASMHCCWEKEVNWLMNVLVS